MSAFRDDLLMSVDEFLAFTDTRPEEERWELIDGEAILNPSPSYGHQKVVRNLVVLLSAFEDGGASWELLPGLGVKLSERSMPVPDVLIRPTASITGHWCDDMIVAFEVLSPSSRSRDMRWKRQAYAKLPSLQHYAVVHQNKIDIRCFDRSTDWAERQSTGGDGYLSLDGIGVTLTATALYAGTGLI